MTPSSATGYAGTPLVRKLGYREGSAVFLAGAPGEYAGWPQTLPPGIVFLSKLGATADLVQVFEVEANVASHQEHQYGACRGGSMRRVTGIGGIFFKAKDAPALQAWYKRHLGIDVQEWGGTAFTWTDAEGKPVAGTTIWSIGAAQGDHFAPSTATFMVNYRVEDLHALVSLLREEGCIVLDKIDESEYGKFAWVIDPEGNKVELWQPPAGQ